MEDCLKKSGPWIKEDIANSKEEFPVWMKSFNTFEIDLDDNIYRASRYFARNIKMIKYYLGKIAFPANCKQFKKKLTGNAHNLSGEGEIKGFSGTDDRNDTMPDSIVPKRLPAQQSTNGKMIHIICRNINRGYRSVKTEKTRDFLMEVCQYANDLNNRCYTLIDCGAIITEISNKQVAQFLIHNLRGNCKGIVYFCDDTNKIKVLLRNGNILPISSCHIDNKCLFVYLDEVHTRGTDLKFPPNTRGIVTVAKHLTKDKYMQAVMRLRQLDFKQSIVTWGLDNISSEIAEVNRVAVEDLSSKHVLIWITYNTIIKNEKDLYPVFIEKIRYIVKKRALYYQNQNYKIPMKSLIQECETLVLDDLEIMYGDTPNPKDPRALLDPKKHKSSINFGIS